MGKVDLPSLTVPCIVFSLTAFYVVVETEANDRCGKQLVWSVFTGVERGGGLPVGEFLTGRGSTTGITAALTD